MPDETAVQDEGYGAEEALAGMLRDLGPLMRLQDAGEEAPPRAAFADALRARLTSQDAAPPARPISAARAPRLRRLWPGLLAAALVTVLATVAIVVVLRPPHGRSPAPTVAVWAPPRPSMADLTRGYPTSPGGGGGGYPPPEWSRLDSFGGTYQGRLTLTRGALPRMAGVLPAYRLRGPAFDAPRVAQLARLLGLRSAVTRTTSGGAAWLTAADNTMATLHSVAIATATGELIYHDLRAQTPPPGTAPNRVSRDRAIAVARAWVTALGWPGQQMPPRAAHYLVGDTETWEVDLGWATVGPATMPAAGLWISAAGQVREARLWPPIAASVRVTARAVTAAWTLIGQGQAPFAVADRVAATAPQGQGVARQVDILQVLVIGKSGALALVPAYRFSGVGQFAVPGAGVVEAWWYALVAATAR